MRNGRRRHYLLSLIHIFNLISSIYEEFYHSSASDDEKKSKARQDGAFYTPSVLVELVLSRSLTAGELQKMCIRDRNSSTGQGRAARNCPAGGRSAERVQGTGSRERGPPGQAGQVPGTGPD